MVIESSIPISSWLIQIAQKNAGQPVNWWFNRSNLRFNWLTSQYDCLILSIITVVSRFIGMLVHSLVTFINFLQFFTIFLILLFFFKRFSLTKLMLVICLMLSEVGTGFYFVIRIHVSTYVFIQLNTNRWVTRQLVVCLYDNWFIILFLFVHNIINVIDWSNDLLIVYIDIITDL